MLLFSPQSTNKSWFFTPEKGKQTLHKSLFFFAWFSMIVDIKKMSVAGAVLSACFRRGATWEKLAQNWYFAPHSYRATFFASRRSVTDSVSQCQPCSSQSSSSTIAPSDFDTETTSEDFVTDEEFEALSLKHYKHRMNQLELLHGSGREAYPHNFDAEMTIAQFRQKFDAIEVGGM